MRSNLPIRAKRWSSSALSGTHQHRLPHASFFGLGRTQPLCWQLTANHTDALAQPWEKPLTLYSSKARGRGLGFLVVIGIAVVGLLAKVGLLWEGLLQQLAEQALLVIFGLSLVILVQKVCGIFGALTSGVAFICL
jgi:hypothetical protein